MSTPRLTEHARARCVEMGISTKVAKRIVQNPTMTYPGPSGTNSTVVLSSLEPKYFVAVNPEGWVITVAFNAPGVTYRRNGDTYEVLEGPR